MSLIAYLVSVPVRHLFVSWRNVLIVSFVGGVWKNLLPDWDFPPAFLMFSFYLNVKKVGGFPDREALSFVMTVLLFYM